MPLKRIFILGTFILINAFAYAQMRGGSFNNMSGMGGRMAVVKTGGDSLQKRDKNADSITIYYKLYNSNDIQQLDSTIQEGDTVILSDVLPDKIKQSDFFNSIIKMFNLFIEIDKSDSKKLKFEIFSFTSLIV